MQANIRAIKEEELEHCIKLINQTGLTVLTNEKDHLCWFRDLLHNKLFLVAELDNKIVGFILGEELKSDGCMLWFIAVNSEYQNKGVGKQLLSTFEKNCKEVGITWLLAYAELNDKTVSFYKSNNFTVGKNFKEVFKEF